MVRHLAKTLLLILPCPLWLHGQSTAARVLGTVTDHSGAVIPGAAVVATSTETGWKTNATSNAAGQYVLFPLPPGIYAIDFHKEGLRSAHIDRLEVSANDEVVRNVALEVGGVSQSVTVEAAAGAAVLNETPSVENIVTEDQVNTLPLNGRDYNQLVFLSAGAVDYSVTGTNYDIGTVAVNGNRAYSNGYLVDGVSNDSSFQNNSAAPLSVALIREFKVISGMAPAEFGQAGTSISVVTKSGTNQFHGNAFEYYRGNALVTRNPFTQTDYLPPYYSHQFGGALGGPVIAPRYNGHNRTFFFVNYEGLRQSGGGTRVSTVAPAAFWQGDFSSLLPRVQLKDPLTPGAPPFPGNKIPVSRLDPTALKLEPLFPGTTAAGLVNNAVVSVNTIATSNQFTAKVDQLLPHNNSLSARVTYFNGGGFNPGELGAPNMGYVQPRHGYNGVLSWTSLLNSSTVNEFRLGATTLTRYDIYFNSGYPNSDTLGMQGTIPISSNLVPPLPIIQFTGTDAFTQLSYWPAAGLGANLSTLANNVYSLSDVVSTTHGQHQLKAGFDGRRTDLNWLYENNGNGSMAFNGSTASRSTGYSFGDFLLGVPASSQLTPLQAKVLYIESDYAFFVQDDWRVRSNVTLTLGLRNEMSYHPEEQYNRLAMFAPSLGGGGIVVACSNGQLPTGEFNPGVVSKLTNAQGKFSFPIACASTVPGYDPRTLVQNHAWNPGPRIGLAWDPAGTGKWLVRSGYGIFYTRFQEQYLSLGIGQNPPFASVFNYSQTVTNGKPNMTLLAPYPTTGTASITPYGIQPDFVLPSNQQWNVSLERALGSNTIVNLTYLGNKGTHLFRSINLNQTELDANGQDRARVSKHVRDGGGELRDVECRLVVSRDAARNSAALQPRPGVSVQLDLGEGPGRRRPGGERVAARCAESGPRPRQ